MELWTEYEGRTIDDVFPLKKLIRPEGRSAFFSTTNGTGVPRLIRLIESHFDDDEILARWRGVAALDHPNLLKLEDYGQVILDETSLVYAVMEPVDANLGDVLNGQRLTPADARQLAASLAAALQALHTHGFIHEHVEPANVFAVGEVVKLRGDCIREAPEGGEGQRLKQRDAHDLAVLILKALTQQWTLEDAASDLPLPQPFDQIVRKGMTGEWGVAEISTVLAPVEARPAIPITSAAPAEPAAAAHRKPSPQPAAPPALKPIAAPRAADRVAVAVEPAGSIEDFSRIHAAETRINLGMGWMALIALAVVLGVWGIWHLAHSHAAQTPTAQQADAQSMAVNIPEPKTSAPNTPAASGPAASAAPSLAANSPRATNPSRAANPPRTLPSEPANSGNQWRVVAFTYNHEDQAQHKSATIAQRHPELHPEVFAPTGHAPYLVTVGGAMTRDQAFAFAAKVRREGLPRDSYAQNYNTKGRG